MINQNSNAVIIHMNMEPATVRFGGADQQVLRPSAHGFCFVETDDGEATPISHPLEEWILDAFNRFGGVGTIFFKITSPGEKSNDGGDMNTGSVTNIQTSL